MFYLFTTTVLSIVYRVNKIKDYFLSKMTAHKYVVSIFDHFNIYHVFIIIIINLKYTSLGVISIFRHGKYKKVLQFL